jgi:hypothetical protein
MYRFFALEKALGARWDNDATASGLKSRMLSLTSDLARKGANSCSSARRPTLTDLARPNKKPGYRSFVSAGTQALDADNRINAGWKNRRAPMEGNRIAEKARVTSNDYIGGFPFGRSYLCKNPAPANRSVFEDEFDLHENQRRVWDLSGLLAKFFVKLSRGRAGRVNMKRRKNDDGVSQMWSPANGIGCGQIAR